MTNSYACIPFLVKLFFNVMSESATSVIKKKNGYVIFHEDELCMFVQLYVCAFHCVWNKDQMMLSDAILPI